MDDQLQQSLDYCSRLLYSGLLTRQGGACAVCKQLPEQGSSLLMDCDQSSGNARGLLCGQCLSTARRLEVDLDHSMSVGGYLLRHRSSRSWDAYFLEIARLVASRSKDPSSQVGAVIVRDRNILSTGYNGFPSGVNDSIQARYERPTKYKWTVHGEENAILNASRNGTAVAGATLYVTPFAPCISCAKAIAQSGITEVVVDARVENPRWTEEFAEAGGILRAARILVRGPE